MDPGNFRETQLVAGADSEGVARGGRMETPGVEGP